MLRRNSNTAPCRAVGAGLGGDVDLSRFASELRWIDPALRLEFLDHVDRWQNDVQIEIDIEVGDAVKRIVLPCRARPGRGNRDAWLACRLRGRKPARAR